MSAVHGIMGAFSSAADFAAAVRRVREAGFTRIETYMPFPVGEVVEGSIDGRSPISIAMATGGTLGGLGAWILQSYAARAYPIDVGGRPLNSWPSFVPITFELTVLGAALAGFVAFLVVAGFPRLDHPVFGDPRFAEASRGRFFVCVRSDDPLFADGRARRALLEAGAESVEEVES